MALQEPMRGTARVKRNSWCRGNGPCSARGELRGGISKNKKVLNRKVRHQSKVLLQNADYKRICRTGMMADLAYFEKDGNDVEEYGIIDYQPPPEFEMGIVLEKNGDPFDQNLILYTINLYFVPEHYLDSCLNHQDIPGRGFSQKWADFETESYRVMVDGRQQTVETGASGDWGLYQEVYSHNGNVNKVEGIVIRIGVPDQEAFEGMRKMIYTLFEDVRPMQLMAKEEQAGKEEMDGADQKNGATQLSDAGGKEEINAGDPIEELIQNPERKEGDGTVSTRETLRDLQNTKMEKAGRQAFCAAYVMAEKYGVDNSGFQFDKICEMQEYGNKEPQELRAFIGNVKNAVYRIARHIDRNLGQPEQEFTVDEFAVSEGTKGEGPQELQKAEEPQMEARKAEEPAEKSQKQKGGRSKKQPER